MGVQVVEHLVRFGVHLRDAIQGVVAHQAQERTRHPVACAVNCREHAAAAHGLEPIEIPGNHVAGLVKDGALAQHFTPLLVGRQDGLLDAQGVVDAVLEVAQHVLHLGLLLGQFLCALLDLALEFALVSRK